MATLTLTISARQQAGLEKACSAFNEELVPQGGTAVSVDQFVSMRVESLLDAYADEHQIGVVTPYEFVHRFDPAEYSRVVELAKTDAAVAGMLTRLKQVSAVHLFAAEVAQGLTYLEAKGVIAPGRAAVIASY